MPSRIGPETESYVSCIYYNEVSWPYNIISALKVSTQVNKCNLYALIPLTNKVGQLGLNETTFVNGVLSLILL